MVDSLEFAQCWSRNSGSQGGRVPQKDLKPSGTAAGEVPDLLSRLDSDTYSQILPALLAPYHPEGFRKCFRKGGSQSSSYFKGSCGAGKPTVVVPRRPSREGTIGQLPKGRPLHDAHLACFRAWPQQVLSLPGTRPQQEQIPPQRKFSRRLDVNNSRVRGRNTWRGAQQTQERLPEEGVAKEVGKLLEREPAK